MEIFPDSSLLKINKTLKMLNNSVNLKDTKKVDHILESSLDFQFLFDAPNIIIYNRKSKTTFNSSLNSHVYWATLYNGILNSDKKKNFFILFFCLGWTKTGLMVWWRKIWTWNFQKTSNLQLLNLCCLGLYMFYKSLKIYFLKSVYIYL